MFSQSGDEEELQSIKDEEEKVRALIQESLAKSDELSVSISRLLFCLTCEAEARHRGYLTFSV